jgi:hypothetical protein
MLYPRKHVKILLVEVSCIFGLEMLFVLIPERLNIVFLNDTILTSPSNFNFCIVPSYKINFVLSSLIFPDLAKIVEDESPT